MRRILLSLLMAFITITAFSQSGDIAVTVVSSESGTGLTTINYGFTGQLNRRYNISVEVKFDAANYVQVPEAHLSGDLTDVSGTGTAFSGTIVWDGAAGFPELYHEQTRIRILATMINTTDIVDVTNPTTGKTWMDRNLGASRAATSSTDAEAYGDLYQWGRGTDGHEKRTSTTTPTLSDSDNPGHGHFIVTSSSPNDWRSPQNDNLWQGVNGINNPCPSGYRIPSIAEWNAERLSWGSNDPAGAFGSQLKLSVGGSRHPVSASLGSVGEYGIYWSSALGGTNSQFLIFGNGDAVVSSANRANGYSVRCIKGAETLSTVTTSSTSNITPSTATSGGNVVSDGGVSVTARGVCWNTTGNPTIADSKTTDAAGYGTYTSSITGLTASTIYYVRAYATNSVGTAYGEQKSFTTSSYISSFCDALDNCNLTFIKGGNAEWFEQTEVSYYGGSSVRSGPISSHQQSALVTTVTGPGVLSFYWKVSCEGNNWDNLNFYIGSILEDHISGDIDWQFKEYEIPEGNHTLKWIYIKDGSVSSGADCGWLDKIVFDR